jgi:hypothetical protein
VFDNDNKLLQKPRLPPWVWRTSFLQLGKFEAVSYIIVGCYGRKPKDISPGLGIFVIAEAEHSVRQLQFSPIRQSYNVDDEPFRIFEGNS